MHSRRDRIVAIAAILGLFSIMLVASPEEREVDDPRPSSLISAESGARALYLTLEALDVPVDRRYRALDTPDAWDGPLALIAPTIEPTGAERQALVEWIEAGGTLLYVARPGDGTLEEIGGDRLVRLDADAPDSATPVAPHPWLAGAGPVHGFTRALAGPDGDGLPGGAVPLLATDSGYVVAATWRLGAGRVIAWSDAAPLRNRALGASGAAVVLARIAADIAAPDRPLRFDEYHHGFRGDGSPIQATLSFLGRTAAGHGVIQLLAAAAGLLLLAGVRFGAPLPPPPAARRSPLEHVEALAELYHRAGARATARRLLIAQFARRLGRRPPAEDGDDEAALDRLTATLPGGRERAADVRAALRRDDLSGLARAIDRLVTEVKGT